MPDSRLPDIVFAKGYPAWRGTKTLEELVAHAGTSFAVNL